MLLIQDRDIVSDVRQVRFQLQANQAVLFVPEILFQMGEKKSAHLARKMSARLRRLHVVTLAILAPNLVQTATNVFLAAQESSDRINRTYVRGVMMGTCRATPAVHTVSLAMRGRMP